MVECWVLMYWALGSIPSMVKDTSSTCLYSNIHTKYKKCWLVPHALLFRYWNQMCVLFFFFPFCCVVRQVFSWAASYSLETQFFSSDKVAPCLTC